MKNIIKLILLAICTILCLSVLTACGDNGDGWNPKGSEITLIEKGAPPNYMCIFFDGDENLSKDAANYFKSQFLGLGLKVQTVLCAHNVPARQNEEILFGKTDRKASEVAAQLLDEKVSANKDAYHWVFYYRDGKLAIVANNAKAYELAAEDFFKKYLSNGNLVFKDTLKEHTAMTFDEYEEYIIAKERAEVEAKKEENEKLLKKLKPLVEEQRTEFQNIKGKWYTYSPISASNPEIYLFKDYTKDIGKTSWGTPPKNPINEHPRLLITEDNLPIIKKALREDTKTNATFKALVDKVLPDEGILPPPTYKGENATVQNKIEHNYDDSYLSAIQAKALAYLIYDDEYYGYQAIYYMKNFLKSLDIKIIPSDQCRQYGYVMYTTALVYDWCYDLLTDVDKVQFIAGVENCLCRGKNDFEAKMEVGFPPSGQGSVNGHGSEYQIMRDYLAFSVAIYDENASWWNYVAARTYNDYIAMRNYYFQSGLAQQGTGYATTRHVSDLYAGWITTVATGENPYVGMENTVRSFLAYEYKTGEMFNDGDGTGDNGRTSSFASCAYITAYLYADSAMLAQAEHLIDKNGFGNSLSGLSATAYVALRGLCELEPAADRHEKMELISYNTYPVSQYIIREAWDDENSVAVFMRLKERSTSNHEHADTGTFEIYYKGMLTSDGGCYNNFGHEHTQYFHQATISHNGLIIYNPSLAATEKGLYSGGQRKVGSAGSTLNAWLKNPDMNTATLTGMQHGYIDGDKTKPLYAYIAGDITAAYSDETVEYVGRRMLTVFTGNEKYPMAFFVYDDITSTNRTYPKRFLLQISSMDAPTIDDKARTVITENGEGRLVLTCLSGNVQINPVGGRTYDSYGKYDCANSKNYLINGKQLLPMNKVADDKHWGRVEIVYTKADKNATFMNVIYVTDKGNKSSANVSEISRAEGCEGGVFDNKIAAIFATDRNGAKDTISCTVPAIKDKDLSYYVSGVAAGNWKVTVNGKDCGTYTATEEGGLLTFSAPAGNIVISPVK